VKLDIENYTINFSAFIMGSKFFVFKMTIEHPSFKLFYVV